MAHDHDHGAHLHGVDGSAYDDFAEEDIDIKEALGLPDALPPIRLLSLPELAARARQAPLPGQLAALTEWVGKDGRVVDEDGDLTADGLARATAALGVDATDFAFLWEYALAVEWLVFDDEEEERVVPGPTAEDWSSGGDAGALAAWSSTLAAVLGETLDLYGPQLEFGAGEEVEPGDGEEFDFTGQGMAIAILLFLTRRDGLTVDEFGDILWENAGGGGAEDLDEDVLDELTQARAAWESAYGDPVRLFLDKLARAHAIVEDGDVIRLSPLALAALHEQLVEAGVDIPLLPPTAAELTGAELIAMAEGVSDAEFETEADAWTAARGADAAARELLGLAAEGQPGERMLAVAVVTQMGAGAEAAWQDSLALPGLRGYAKVALLQLGGFETEHGPAGDVPPSLELGPDDLAWVATDLLSLACDDDYPDPDDLAVSFREAVPIGQETALFSEMARGAHPAAVDVLTHLGRYHPDKQVAKLARTAAHKASSR